jgi:hypothetical protein
MVPRLIKNAIVQEEVMSRHNRILSLSIAATLAAAAGPAAIAQQSYPDLKGKWIGPGQSVTVGKTDQWPNTGESGPVFREGSWTVTIDRQEGNRFTGSQGMTDGTRRDQILGVIRADQKSILMIDDDGTFLATLTGQDTMEMCRTEITFNSHLVGCRQLARQK